MEEEIKKIDGRKFNRGRGVKKNKNTTEEQPVMEETNKELNTNSMENNSENNENNITENNGGENITTPVEETKIEDKNDIIQNAEIIDESKLSDVITETDKIHTPVNEKVIQEEYRNPFLGKGNPDEIIPEVKFEKPDIDALKAQMFGGDKKTEETKSSSETSNTSTTSSSSSTFSKIVANPALANATPEEKKQGAEQLVDGVLDFYGLLHQAGAWAASVNMDKLEEEQLDGKINLGLQIPVDEETTVSLKDFLENYNKECKKAISVNPEFVAKVRPVMIRVCEKNGWGLSDEQYLIYMFGRDITEKVAMIIGMKRAMNASLRMIKKSFAKQQAIQNNMENGNGNQNNNSESNVNYRERAESQSFGMNNKDEKIPLVPTEEVGAENNTLTSLTVNESKENPDLNQNKQ